jgi:hypothetical protein
MDTNAKRKRPTTVSKETYYSVKRDLLHTTADSMYVWIQTHTHTHTHKAENEGMNTEGNMRQLRGLKAMLHLTDDAKGKAATEVF